MKLPTIKTGFYQGLPNNDASVNDICETESLPDSGIFSDQSNDIVSPPSGLLEVLTVRNKDKVR